MNTQIPELDVFRYNNYKKYNNILYNIPDLTPEYLKGIVDVCAYEM